MAAEETTKQTEGRTKVLSIFDWAPREAPEDRLRELALAADPRLETIVINFEGINLIDSQGSEAIGKIFDLAGYNDIEVRLARLKGRVQRILESDGVIDRLGTDKIYGNTYEAVADLIPPDEH